MTNSITVEIRSLYGNEVVYPVDDAAQAFARISGTKTLTDYTLSQVKRLGFKIDVKQPELKHRETYKEASA